MDEVAVDGAIGMMIGIEADEVVEESVRGVHHQETGTEIATTVVIVQTGGMTGVETIRIETGNEIKTGIEMEQETEIATASVTGTGTGTALDTMIAALVHHHLVVAAPRPATETGTVSEMAKRLSSKPSTTEPTETLNAPPPPPMDLDPEEGEDLSEADAAMMAQMGFGGFGTTKGKEVQGNQEGGVSIKKQRTWRQYMNRKGGFNRPLDKIK
ncbi:hypothetical protein FRB90_011992 [Tulasnella sp. 427]|nr:hypothetical protein FRB90_011992 [Tulasnella sp. 427]